MYGFYFTAFIEFMLAGQTLLDLLLIYFQPMTLKKMQANI